MWRPATLSGSLYVSHRASAVAEPSARPDGDHPAMLEPGASVSREGDSSRVTVLRRARRSRGANQLDPVAPWVGCIEPTRLRDRIVPLHGHAGRRQPVGNPIEVAEANPQCWMGLGRGREVFRHPHVKLMRPAGKPDAAAVPESRRLLELWETDELSVEPPGSALASDWRGDLHMVETDYLHARTVAHENGPAGGLGCASGLTRGRLTR
jgi:hypothetical protein